MRNTILASLAGGRKWMFGMVAAAGLLTAGTVAAEAQAPYQGQQYPAQNPNQGQYQGQGQYPDQGQYQDQGQGQYADQGQYQGQEGYDTAAIPPCPGDGYVWTVGYYNGGYWVPGAWRFRGAGYRVYPGWGRGYAYGYGGGYRPGVRFDARGGGWAGRGYAGRGQSFGRVQGGGFQGRGFAGGGHGFAGGHGGHR